MGICLPMYVCQNSSTLLECFGCNANSFFGLNVVETNGEYYFDSSNLTPGQYEVEAQCSAGSPTVSVTVMNSQLTINGQPYNNDTLQYCLPSDGYQLGINNLLPGYSASWIQADGLNTPLGSSPIVNPSVNTTYIVTITAPDNYTSCTNQITLIPIQGYNLTLGVSNANICLGQSISLSPTVFPQNSNWIINSNTGQSWNSQNLPALIYPSQSSVYVLSVSNNSCTNSVQASVSVQPLPIGSVFPLQEKCVGDLFYLSAQTYSSNQVSWYNQSGQLVGVGPNIGQYAQFSQTYSCLITNSSGCSTTIPVNLSVNLNCCTNDSPLPANISSNISANTIWNGVNYTLTNDIVVMPGVTLTILNSTLKFGNLKGIILQEGADLKIQNSTLTNLDNCPNAWTGISASHSVLLINGNSDYSEINITNSTISHAYCGLSVITTPPQSGSSGVVIPWAKVICTSVNFLDNKKDMRVMGYAYNQSQIDLSMKRCSFNISSNYPSYLNHSSNRVEVGFNAKAVYEFVNCSFVNNRYGFLAAPELVGLYSKTAKINVIGDIVNLDGTNMSKFVGYTRGIKMEGSGDIEIAKTDFLNYRNILVSSNDQVVKIHDCRLLNLPSSYWLSTNQNAPFVESANILNEPSNPNFLNVAYGIYLNSCSGGIIVKDNYFNINKSFVNYPINNLVVASLNSTEHGLIVHNCVTASGEITRNTFTNMKRAAKCQGQNKTGQLNGVKFLCNNFFGNCRDIVVLSQNQGQLIGLPTQQKNMKDPHNSFTQSAESFDDIQNLTNPFMYFYSALLPMNLSIVESNNLLINPSNLIVDCNTLTYSSDLSQNKNTYQDTWDFWNSTKDGGNSDDLISIIESADFQSALEDLFPLIQASPYLSMDVILKSIKNQNIPNYLLAQILAYNSSSLTNLELKQELENRVVSLTEFEESIVYQAANFWSSKDYLFGQLNYLEEEHQRLLGEIRLSPDSLLSPTSKDSIMNLYVDPAIFYSDFRNSIIKLTMNGDYTDGEILYNQFAQNYDMLPSQKLELNQLISVASDLSVTSLSVKDYYDQHTELTPLSKNLVSHFFRDTLYHHVDFILDELENRSMSEESVSEYKMNSMIYPNPCNASFFSVSVPIGNYRMEINNEIGQCVYDKIGNLGQTVYIINVTDFVNGLYSVRLTNLQTNQIEVHKLIIQK